MKRIKLMLLGVGLAAASGLLGTVIDDIRANEFTDVDRDEANIADEDGMTPLMWAALMGNEYAANNLFRVGADIHAKDKVGRDAIIYANQEAPGSDVSKKVAISIALTSKGADLERSLKEAENRVKEAPTRTQVKEVMEDESLDEVAATNFIMNNKRKILIGLAAIGALAAGGYAYKTGKIPSKQQLRDAASKVGEYASKISQYGASWLPAAAMPQADVDWLAPAPAWGESAWRQPKLMSEVDLES